LNYFPRNVKLLSTPRFIYGGKSKGNFKNFNLAHHVNDYDEDVKMNRSLLRDYYDLPSDPSWINQTHSSNCINASQFDPEENADASFTRDLGTVCAILTADCLPVFVSNKRGSMVGIAHAGWRGLVSGVIENLINSFGCEGNDLVVHLGPSISKHCFEVGKEIKDIYLYKNPNFERSFSCHNNRYFLDLYDAATVILEGFQIHLITGGNRCTFQESNDFFSYRRDGINSGRMAHLIWMI
jgi:YfiH family protein